MRERCQRKVTPAHLHAREGRRVASASCAVSRSVHAGQRPYHHSMRAFWVVIVVVFSVLSGLGAAATVYSLISGDDDLPGNAILLTGALAFAAIGWYGLRVLD